MLRRTGDDGRQMTGGTICRWMLDGLRDERIVGAEGRGNEQEAGRLPHAGAQAGESRQSFRRRTGRAFADDDFLSTDDRLTKDRHGLAVKK
ncbi:hypothetical protein ACLOJK_011480 [Asimina triloba]